MNISIRQRRHLDWLQRRLVVLPEMDQLIRHSTLDLHRTLPFNRLPRPDYPLGLHHVHSNKPFREAPEFVPVPPTTFSAPTRSTARAYLRHDPQSLPTHVRPCRLPSLSSQILCPPPLPRTPGADPPAALRSRLGQPYQATTPETEHRVECNNAFPAHPFSPRQSPLESPTGHVPKPVSPPEESNATTPNCQQPFRGQMRSQEDDYCVPQTPKPCEPSLSPQV
jgi:hypothetical protein